ncbi:MAG: ribonuclease P protein component, partial [Candidatus Gottesmanbacteria bacterium]
MTLPIQRLPSSLIPALFKTGFRITTPSLQCLVSPSNNARSQYAVVVGVKVQKSAVKRNRMKRIIRAAFTYLLPTLPHPIHCIAVIKKDCSMKNSKDMI